MMGRSLLFRFIVFGSVTVFGPTLMLWSNSAAAQGVTQSWDGGGATDDWFDPLNWSLNLAPDDADFLAISLNDVAGLNTNDVDIADGGRIEIINSTAVVTLNRLDIGSDGDGSDPLPSR